MSAVTTQVPSRLGGLVLAWLLSHPEGGTPREIDEGALYGAIEQQWSAAARRRAVTDEVEALARAGRIARCRKAAWMLPESGRREALKALGMGSLPAKVGWKTLKLRYLLACAVELILQQKSAAAAPLLEAAIKLPVRPVIALPAEDGPFAKQVLAAAKASKTGRFGDNKVFIAHVLRQLAAEGFAVDDAEAIKARMVSVHRAGLLSLSRADLVEAMAPEDVDTSETRYLNATFHFVRV